MEIVKTQASEAQKRMVTLASTLEKKKGALALAVPKHVNADRLTRIVLTAVQEQPKLLECSVASIMRSVLRSAQLGLYPDGLGQGYLVPFWNKKNGQMECQFMPGYRGLISLCLQSGMVSSISARPVYEGDEFSYAFGLVEKLEHRPAEKPDAKLTHAYAVARFTVPGRDPSIDVMPRFSIDRIRGLSQTGEAKWGPWAAHYDAMAIKTVIKRLCKTLPQSTELRLALAMDNEAESGESILAPELIDIDAKIESVIGDDEEAPAPKKSALDAVTEKVKAKVEREPGVEG